MKSRKFMAALCVASIVALSVCGCSKPKPHGSSYKDLKAEFIKSCHELETFLKSDPQVTKLCQKNHSICTELRQLEKSYVAAKAGGKNPQQLQDIVNQYTNTCIVLKLAQPFLADLRAYSGAQRFLRDLHDIKVVMIKTDPERYKADEKELEQYVDNACKPLEVLNEAKSATEPVTKPAWTAIQQRTKKGDRVSGEAIIVEFTKSAIVYLESKAAPAKK